MYILVLCKGVENQKKMLILEFEICTVLEIWYIQSSLFPIAPTVVATEFLLFINYFESAHINSRLIQPIHT